MKQPIIKKIRIQKSLLAVAIAASLPFSAQALDGLTYNGFGTIGAAVIGDSETSYIGADAIRQEEGFVDDKFSFEADSKVGIQFDFAISEKAAFTAQVLARGQDDYDLSAEWAYLTWSFSPDTDLRLGRTRLPLFLYSDTLDVSYSYHWIRPPLEVYTHPLINNSNGFDLLSRWQIGGMELGVQLIGGQASEDVSFGELDYNNVIGSALSLEGNGWLLRGLIGQVDLDYSVESISPSIASAIVANGGGNQAMQDAAAAGAKGPEVVFDDSAKFFNLGFRGEWGNFLLSAEHVWLEFDGRVDVDAGSLDLLLASGQASPEQTLQLNLLKAANGQPLSPDIRAWYVSAGYRFGKWTPHLTYAETDDKGAPPSAPRSPFGEYSKQNTTTAGVRYDADGGYAIKFEYAHIKATENSRGLFGPGAEENQSDNMISIAVDTVF
ncbi:hypothetical protein [Pelagibaculum spongiae]|uniref:Porin domain-containing protein n=1 Tax=Pelagibaculum spongiae TaxID=2080658 RepID=A0A2V1GWC6_9GAMM|nr:hypothetical protein [Pelagibaculum spongiae]PVZ71481.1 hypothetical protein DC094_00050 [Pelagibaculum spongiae]